MRPHNDIPPTDVLDVPQRRRKSAPAISPTSVAVAIAVAIVVFVLARVALDALLLLVGLAVVGVLRRTAGDWLGDLLGVRGGTVAFAVIISAAGWWLVGTDGGRASVGQFFAEAGRLGFGSVLGNGVVVSPSTGLVTSSPTPSGTISPSPPASTGITAPAATPSTPARASAAADDARSVAPVRLTVRATNTTPDRVVLQATLSSSAGSPDGRVEFRIDGRVVATARVGSDGNAETTISVARSGSYRVQVRYAGNSRFGAATGETNFTL
jgi:hypothetical protein